MPSDEGVSIRQKTVGPLPAEKNNDRDIGGLNMRFPWSLAMIGFGLMGCGLSASVDSAPAGSESPVAISESTRASESEADESEAGNAIAISEQGIGAAQFGMTLGQLKQTLTPDIEVKIESPFIVDFDAIAIVKANVVQYYILHFADLTLADSDQFDILLTDNPNALTAEGIGPGTSLKQAEAVYGKPTLSYHLANEGREYVRFAKQPSDNFAFRLGSFGDETLAGIYAKSNDEYSETHNYKEDATIQWIEVHCPESACPPIQN